VVVTVDKKWLIIGGVAGASIAGIFGGLYLAGYMVRKSTEQIIKQVQTTLPPTTLSTPPTQSPTAPPPPTTQQQPPQTTERKLPPIQVGGFLPPGYAPPLPPTPPKVCTGTCPPGTIPMLPGIAHMAGCPVITTVCGVVCVPNLGSCLQKANQIEIRLLPYTSPQYIY
jgi:hypothetical protein